MRKSIGIHNFILTICTCVLLALLLTCASITAHAEEKQQKVVRVGWYDSQFNKIDEFGRRTGYGYEYQQKIAAYTGWKYEYVEGGWVELLDMLKTGQLDMLSDVSITEEREAMMLFSTQEMISEDYCILVRADNKEINPEDFSTLSGKKIGINRGSIQEKMFLNWAEKHDVKPLIIGLLGNESVNLRALENGELDAFVSVSAFEAGMKSCVPIATIGSSKAYFALSKGRDDLKQELDVAMSQIESQNEDYDRYLKEKYMSNDGAYHFLPQSELAWLEEHGTIRIGYRDNYLPFCGMNPQTGENAGLLKDFIEDTVDSIKNAKVSVELIPYPSTNDALLALRRGEIDSVFPVAFSVYDAEERGMLVTEPLVESDEVAIIRNTDLGSFDLSGEVNAAINLGNPNYETVIKDYFPNWKTRYYTSTEKCLQAIARGGVDCLLASNYRQTVLANQLKQYNLSAISSGASMKLAFAVNSQDIYLYSILGRLTKNMTDAEVHASLANNSQVKYDVTVEEFARQNAGILVLILAMVLALVSFLLFISASSEKRARKLNFFLTESQKKLAGVLVEQEKQIDEISTLNGKLEEAKQAAEAANSAKTAFLFNMSHDIRTPMNAIMGFRDLLEKHQDNPEKREDYLRKIEDSSDVLLSIINNVLEMARIEKGTIEIEEHAWSTELFNDSLYCVFLEMMAEKNITFTRDIQIEHHYVFCDTTKLREIFINILSNAYKYTNSGGSVHLELKELPYEREGWVLFQTTVSDTGIGMSEEFLPHVFEEFARETNTTDNKIEGTGLGMPIVKRLVELMDGTIRVESQKGVGSTFVVALPHRIAAKEDLTEHADEVTNTDLFIGKRILLAEDNELNAEIAIEVLEEMGFMVERAEDGKAALEMVKKEAFDYYDVILMDIQMPKMNGYQATLEIRHLEDSRKAGIPILAMTANAFEEDKREAGRAGMNGHLSKPINVKEMMKEIAFVLK